MTAERTLVWLLRIVGAVCVSGIVGLFLPSSVMAAVHELAGLGEFPEQPIAQYLARSTSALCALYGALLIVASSDVHRFGPIITLQAIGIMFLSAAAILMCLHSGRLLWFVVADAVACWGYSIPVLALQKHINKQLTTDN